MCYDVQKKNRSEHERARDRDRGECKRDSTVKIQRKEEERLVEKKTLNVMLHSLHGVEGRGEREARKKEGGLGEGRERRRVTREKV